MGRQEKEVGAVSIMGLLGLGGDAGRSKHQALFKPRSHSAKPKSRLIALRVSESDWEALQELQRLAGVSSMSELLRLALKSYHYVLRLLAEGKEIHIYDPKDRSSGEDIERSKHKVAV